jgi:hypothetical protein
MGTTVSRSVTNSFFLGGSVKGNVHMTKPTNMNKLQEYFEESFHNILTKTPSFAKKLQTVSKICSCLNAKSGHFDITVRK